MDRYISSDPRNKDHYNDIDCPMDEAIHKRLLDNGQYAERYGPFPAVHADTRSWRL